MTTGSKPERNTAGNLLVVPLKRKACRNMEILGSTGAGRSLEDILGK